MHIDMYMYTCMLVYVVITLGIYLQYHALFKHLLPTRI